MSRRMIRPAVVAIALVTLVAWIALGPEPSVAYGLVAAVSVLIIACPCALGLATPISIMIGVGKAAGVELNAFVDSLQQMPDLDAIVNGESVEAPKEIDLQYAVATALVGKAIRAKETDDAMKVHGNILNYANNFPQREMGVMMVSDMNRAIGEELFSVPEFSDWADSIADLMIFGK